jgi:hypothetical protein
MELVKIDYLVEKYFQGNQYCRRKNYVLIFSSSDVAQHLEQYRPIFEYFSLAKSSSLRLKYHNSQSGKHKMLRGYHLQRLLLLLGIGTYVYHNYDDATNSQNLGTYDDPEEAFRATQKHCPYCLVM